MRSRPALAARLASLGMLLALGANAEPPGTQPASPRAADVTEAARAHFKAGMRLYQDQNFAGALVEFQAAYELKPGPGSLQNVALCQKALFRYGEAADSLTQLLTLHDAALSEAERSAAKRARDELEALVGPVRLVVVPPTAEVTVDGRVLTGVDRSGRLRLSVGEHTLGASAPGYAPLTTTIQVQSGQPELAVELTLQAAPPTAPVAPSDAPSAAGTPSATPGAPGAPPPPPAPPTATAKAATGWYGVGSVSLLATGATPFRFDLSTARSGAFALGAHAGYRLKPAVALEGLLEYEVLKVRHACDEAAGNAAPKAVACDADDAIFVNYLIRSFRFGPTLELMTTDPRFRAVGGIGAGGVWHELRLGLERGAGVDPYLLLEIGVAANTKHVLFTLVAQTVVDGTRQMIGGRYLDSENTIHEDAFEQSGRALTYVGLNLRVGYSQWAP
jgi:hypothetical protein